MNTPTLYGIKNCDTMKKALRWMEEQGIAHSFHDYKKQGVDEPILKSAIEKLGWETVINRRGISWRQLDETAKAAMNDETAFKAALDNPSLIKRPLLVQDDTMITGFDEKQYKEIFEK